LARRPSWGGHPAATSHDLVGELASGQRFEGSTVVGAPKVVLLRGHVVLHDDELVAEPGVGEFVARAPVGS
jgi:hypothetical protein